MSRLRAALHAARLGFKVFPLHHPVRLDGRLVCSCGKDCGRNAAKHPIPRFAPHGHNSATAAVHMVNTWWGLEPQANVGITAPDILILDVDPRHGGDDALARLEAEHCELPPTWRCLTGGGGEHIFLRLPPGPPPIPKELVPGIDLKGAGIGYVVAAGSLHISGRPYAWSVDHYPDEMPLALVPQWLLELLARQKAGKARVDPKVWRKMVAEGVDEGGRNNAIAKLSGLLLRRFVDPIVTLELVQAWNAARCRPPLPETEVLKIVNSIAAAELRRRGAANA